MARPKNPQRTADLRAAAAEIVQRHGIAGTTLRPLATELGVAPRTLLYHFGSKDNLLVEVIRDLRHRQPHITRLLSEDASADQEPADRLTAAVEHLWTEAKQVASRPFLALYFELSALAIRDPAQYRPLLIEIDRDWVDAITDYLIRSGITGKDAQTITDALLIGYRGALSFALATEGWEAADASVTALMGDLGNRLSRLTHKSPRLTTQH